MYQKLKFFPSEMIFYEFDGSYIEHVRYDPFLLSESEPKPGTDSLFPGQNRPFAFELHTAIARYEAVIDEAAAIATACMKNLNLILPTTYAIADVILSSKNFGSIIAAKYNLFYVKHYLASLDGKYKSFPDKYWPSWCSRASSTAFWTTCPRSTCTWSIRIRTAWRTCFSSCARTA